MRAKTHSVLLQQDGETQVELGRYVIRGGPRAIRFELDGGQVRATFPLQRTFFDPRTHGVLLALYARDDLRKEYLPWLSNPLYAVELDGREYMVMGGETYEDLAGKDPWD
jgi:hypothetical protein